MARVKARRAVGGKLTYFELDLLVVGGEVWLINMYDGVVWDYSN